MADRLPREPPATGDHRDPTTALVRAAEERRRARVAQLARGWFPTLDADTLEAICQRAWEETHDETARAGRSGDSRAALAAAAVRRHGLRALRGEPPLGGTEASGAPGSRDERPGRARSGRRVWPGRGRGTTKR